MRNSMKALTFVIVLMLATISTFAADLDGGFQELTNTSDVLRLSSEETIFRLQSILQDIRYTALQQVANERYLHLDTQRTKGVIFREGHQAIFIPVFDALGQERGFLVNSDTAYILSIEIEQKASSVFEGFSATFDEQNRVRIEVDSRSKLNNPEHRRLEFSSNFADACRYLDGVGLSFACWSHDENPFGYYYVTVYRIGSTPDPRSPTWWACWWGSIHVCPRYENPGSPYRLAVCGIPPSHPVE